MTSDEPRLLVRRVVDAPAEIVFAALADPAVQAAIDGSDMLRGAIDPVPLTGLGDVFTMAMYQPALGDYVMENTVTVFERPRRIGWAPNRQGLPPRGSYWGWELEPLGDGRTGLTQVYDWSGVTDPEFLAAAQFPRVKEDQIVGTMQRLADHLGVALEA